MKLCMFTPRDLQLERGWPGIIEDDTVVQLAAQTLQAFFTGGGTAREHDEFALDDVVFRAPVLYPPTVRIFGQDGDFTFANSVHLWGTQNPRFFEGTAVAKAAAAELARTPVQVATK